MKQYINPAILVLEVNCNDVISTSMTFGGSGKDNLSVISGSDLGL